jgi:hypothetical protein
VQRDRLDLDRHIERDVHATVLRIIQRARVGSADALAIRDLRADAILFEDLLDGVGAFDRQILVALSVALPVGGADQLDDRLGVFLQRRNDDLLEMVAQLDLEIVKIEVGISGRTCARGTRICLGLDLASAAHVCNSMPDWFPAPCRRVIPTQAAANMSCEAGRNFSRDFPGSGSKGTGAASLCRRGLAQQPSIGPQAADDFERPGRRHRSSIQNAGISIFFVGPVGF